MKYCNVSVFIFVINIIAIAALKNWTNTPNFECVKCLCHAETNCHSLQNCALHSIYFDYWIEAGSPVINTEDEPDQEGYKKCMQDDNCIAHTIIVYTEQICNKKDINCDGKFDCFDRSAAHYGKCNRYQDVVYYKAKKKRFESCFDKKYNLCSSK